MDIYNKPPLDECLAHHGIKGQRWGVRNGPPYPLDAEDHSASEKKAGWRKSLDKGDKKADNKTKKGAADSVEKKGLTDKQKRAIKIGAGIVVGLLAVYGTYKLADSGELHRLAEKGKEILQGNRYPGFKRNDAFSQPMSIDQISNTFLHKINPGYNKIPGTTNNCRRCTFAYELSRRGYDVKATRTLYGTGQTDSKTAKYIGAEGITLKSISQLFKDTAEKAGEGVERSALSQSVAKELDRLTRRESLSFLKKNQGITRQSEKIFDALSKMPNRARGELGLKFLVGGGHSIAWEIVDGKPALFDFQTGTAYRTVEELNALVKPFIAKEGFIRRLDDVELNLDLLRRWVEND
ncbi:toxin glutamine deamidase domain-containing protein [Turicimonas muris]|uniref:toxin glutamine deamidase domain-containing protein n=1 Tax=Turicimonas muris TaxID=1796652 RepID=UPI00266F27DA|nr:toxin glutamine deamidase domain-containing protein [Turicimonas muris]